MKLLLAFILINVVFYKVCSACELINPVRHINPDSTQGGLISAAAKVSPSAFVDFEARVCDSAWVDGNTKILDQATIKGSAWVREFSTVRDRAVVSEHAVIWGNKGFPVIVEGDSNIFGSAKILAGTRVSDHSRVYGNSTLKSSTLVNKARVCENYILTNENLTGNYYCAEGEEILSVANLYLKSFQLDRFNAPVEEIVFKIEIFDFSQRKENYQIFINNNQILPEVIEVNRSELVINSMGYLKNGVNEIRFKGRDALDKAIDEVFVFLVGTAEKNISIRDSTNQIESEMSFEIEFRYDGHNYQAESSFSNGTLNIHNIPTNLQFSSISLKAVGQSSFIVEDYRDYSEIPEEIISTLIPIYIDNNTSIHEDLNTWSISNPDQVEISQIEGQNAIGVIPHTDDRVELMKTFKLSGELRTINASLAFDTNALNQLNSAEEQVQVIFVSPQDKKVEVFNYRKSEMDFYAGKDVSFPTLSARVSRKGEKSSSFTLVYRVLPSRNQGPLYKTWLKMFGIILEEVSVDFKPQNFSPLNKSIASLKSTFATIPTDCSELSYIVKSNDDDTSKKWEYVRDEELPFFSAGKTPMMPGFKDNRIFGSIAIKGVPAGFLSNIYLVLEQGGKEVFREELAYCSKLKMEKWNSQKLIEGEKRTDFYISDNDNLRSFLFSVSRRKIESIIIPAQSSLNHIEPKVILKLVAEVDVPGSGKVYFSSKSHEKKLLSSPDLGLGYVRNPFGSIDDYDHNGALMLRTGGDKWIRPFYSKMFQEMLGDKNWEVNDISKLNGGSFPIHKTHQSGVDMDLFTRDPFDLNSERTLNSIEEFLIQEKDKSVYVKEYLLTNSGTPENPSLLEKKFKNRCIGDRFISLTTDHDTGSLIRNAKDHSDHMHLTFYEPEDLLKRQKNPPENVRIDDFAFDFSQENKLVVSLREGKEQLYADKKILWRFQDGFDFEGTHMNVQFGEIDPSSKLNTISIDYNPLTFDLKAIFLVVASKEGWCTTKRIIIESPGVLIHEN
jgi:carbonic anhydrase/acetyltransferase-like protein (isoleucine patch superfamily)